MMVTRRPAGASISFIAEGNAPSSQTPQSPLEPVSSPFTLRLNRSRPARSPVQIWSTPSLPPSPVTSKVTESPSCGQLPDLLSSSFQPSSLDGRSRGRSGTTGWGGGVHS
ncbi:hypothetical protein [Nonomuraea recticatena]|uniref:hypothetical protein n=1 Tax=Nonomuraea recticatena TaxID=46178 RepID=UPI003607376D